MKKQYFANVNETLYSETLPNGLKVFILPKPEYVETCAAFATQFGSFDSTKFVKTTHGFRKAEDGIAHFLEHRMFDNARGQVFDLFSELGAISNAFTSYDKTVYYYVTSDQWQPSLKLLMDFVQDFRVSEESVTKEKDIIIQELRMYRDMPDFRLYRGLLENMYSVHPIRVDVGGTEESVRATDRELLVSCHQTFYHPQNMILVIVGNVDPEEAMAIIRKNQEEKQFADPLVYDERQASENLEIPNSFGKAEMDVNMPKIALGFKLPPISQELSSFELNKRLVAYDMYTTLLFDRSGPYYQKWLASGLMSPSLDASHVHGKGYNGMVIMVDSPQPDVMVDELVKAIQNTPLQDLKEAFDIQRRSEIGTVLRALNRPDRETMNFINNLIQGTSIFDDIQCLEALTMNDIVAVSEEVKKAAMTQFRIESNTAHD